MSKRKNLLPVFLYRVCLPELSPSLVFVCRDWNFHLAEIPVSLAHLEYSLVLPTEIDARPVWLDLLL